MNQTCDRCGPAVRAAYRAARAGELYLCRHCTNQLRAALSAQGWAIWPIGQHVLVRQAPWPTRAKGVEDRPEPAHSYYRYWYWGPM